MPGMPMPPRPPRRAAAVEHGRMATDKATTRPPQRREEKRGENIVWLLLSVRQNNVSNRPRDTVRDERVEELPTPIFHVSTIAAVPDRILASRHCTPGDSHVGLCRGCGEARGRVGDRRIKPRPQGRVSLRMRECSKPALGGRLGAVSGTCRSRSGCGKGGDLRGHVHPSYTRAARATRQSI